MTTNDIIEHIKAKDKEIEELETDLQLLIFSAQKLASLIKGVEFEHKPGCSDRVVTSVNQDIDRLCVRYSLQSKSSF